MPSNYDSGTFETCQADDVAQPMGVYKNKDGSVSTWHQGVSPTPAAQPIPKSSSCSRSGPVGGQAYAQAAQVRTLWLTSELD